MSYDNDLPEFELGVTSTELFAIKTALTHSDNYYTRRQMGLADDHPKRAQVVREHRAVLDAMKQVDALMERVIGVSAY
jgi:hypothetical protein